VLTVFLLLGGWFFFAMLRQFDEMVQLIQMMGQTDQLKEMNLNTRVIDPLLHDLSIVLVIVMPALTMRVFAEEKAHWHLRIAADRADSHRRNCRR